MALQGCHLLGVLKPLPNADFAHRAVLSVDTDVVGDVALQRSDGRNERRLTFVKQSPDLLVFGRIEPPREILTTGMF
jgi:hypothetical protein